MTWVHELLGVAADADAATIKRAYARLLRTTRPDDDAAAFQRLNTAYQTAIAQLGKRVAQPSSASPSQTPASAKPCDPVRLEMHKPPQAAPRPAESSALEILNPPALFFSNPQSNSAQKTRDISPHLTPDPSTPSSVDFDALHRALAMIAIKGDADTVRSWLDAQPELWSLPVKQAFARTLLARLKQVPIPMPSSCFDTLLDYFQLNDVSAIPDKSAQTKLVDLLRSLYSPITKYKNFLDQWVDPSHELDEQSYLQQLRETCSSGDSDRLHAWLAVTGLAWPNLKRKSISEATLNLVRHTPMPRACFEVLREHFQWPADVLDDHEQNTSRRIAENHLHWLLLPTNEYALTRITKSPYENPPDIQRMRSIRKTLSRFAWWEIALHCIEFKGPKRIADFIYSICFECKLECTQPLSNFFNPKAIRFWPKAASPTWKTRERSLILGSHILALLAIEVVACLAQIPATPNGASNLSATDLVIILVQSTICVVLPISISLRLLAWQARPEPAHIPLARFHTSVVPWVCLLCIGAAHGEAPLRPFAYGFGVAAALFALVRCGNNPSRYRKYAVTAVLAAFVIAYSSNIAHGQLSPSAIAAGAFSLWIAGLATRERTGQIIPDDSPATRMSANRNMDP
ncbi:J domain-containing protein [Rhodanobacter sp. 7MK24]|uniref:J domain-containing protein n=1 Tax=Rhodanobacter sp. 7MK24 TaxID=2775922 RepID=UPI00178773AA|nr:J domain-containing protein [Rhodanobacter sp. 7MK24]MBD8880367.1 J domain-containing protein [Rhodanobacter sp. 7MK24]